MNAGSKLTPAHKLALYSVSGALLATGAVWAWLPGDGGEAWRNLKPWLLKVHGLCAMVFVLILGTLIAGHVPAGWRARKNLTNGVLFLASVGVLTLSGYFLYYIGGETQRLVVGRVHLWLGLAAPLLLLWHIRGGKGGARSDR